MLSRPSSLRGRFFLGFLCPFRSLGAPLRQFSCATLHAHGAYPSPIIQNDTGEHVRIRLPSTPRKLVAAMQTSPYFDLGPSVISHNKVVDVTSETVHNLSHLAQLREHRRFMARPLRSVGASMRLLPMFKHGVKGFSQFWRLYCHYHLSP